ncbi:MAG: tetratricopeptide (TPR) repeat protein [Motiliproteus sp.]|jgi:tetratricopeptide (TPR) repeat protein
MPSTPPFSADKTSSGQQMTLPEAMQLAFQHQSQGRLPQAENLLTLILQAAPQHAQALHLLGVVTHQAGNTAKAINIIAQAIANKPGEAQFHSNIGEMCRKLERLEEAIRYGEQAVALEPGSATAQSNLGIAYYDHKELDKASACQQRALAINPQLLSAINNTGSIARELKDKETAIATYRKALAITPDHLESINNLGATLTEAEQPEQAIEILLRAIQLNPNYAEAHCNIATAFLSLEQLNKAEIGFKKALAINPNYAEAYQGLATLHQEQKALPQAREMIDKALTIAPDKASALSLSGGIYSESGFPDKAAQAYSEALALDPELITAYLGKGHLFMEQGEISDAEACFSHALSLDDTNLGARLSLAQVKKVKKGDNNFKALIQQAKELDSMMETKALPLHFALGKSYDDTKQYDLAFKHYLQGCRLKRKRVQYSPENNDKAISKIKEFFSKEALEAFRGEGCSSAVPIFVLGMPRSGTTLTEQILASHPDVQGAGELPDLLQLANQPNDWETSGYPEVLTGFSHTQFKTLGEKYVKGLLQRHPDAIHITDKMPANFNALGLIHLLLPHAKIVHVKRSPIDTCLSGFSKLFNKSQYQSYDLAEIGRYYRNYHALMAHWHAVLPEGSFYDIQYEDLVADTENQARALLEYCGLEWNEACLDFHNTKRNIRTASITQVRQPIYKTSVERWRSYEAHLGPLFDALGDLAPER